LAANGYFARSELTTPHICAAPPLTAWLGLGCSLPTQSMGAFIRFITTVSVCAWESTLKAWDACCTAPFAMTTCCCTGAKAAASWVACGFCEARSAAPARLESAVM
jgi:hypothetical protein